MVHGQKIVVVMLAYNAAQTLRQTYEEIMALAIVDLVIVVDDASNDETATMARELPNVQVEVPSAEPWLRRQSKNLLSARARRRRQHRNYDSPRLSIYAGSDSGDGLARGERPLSMRARLAHSRWRGTLRWHAVVEVHFQPCPYITPKFAPWCKAL